MTNRPTVNAESEERRSVMSIDEKATGQVLVCIGGGDLLTLGEFTLTIPPLLSDEEFGALVRDGIAGGLRSAADELYLRHPASNR